MKLLKFNLIFLPLVALCLGSVGLAAQRLFMANANEEVVHNARIMMETATSSRTYTTRQVAPLLQRKDFKLQQAIADFQKSVGEIPTDPEPVAPRDVKYTSAKKAYLLGQERILQAQKQLIDSLKNKPEQFIDTEFHPQSVPAFAATEIFNYLRDKYPEYTYKEAALNPTNPRDRSTDWEADIINQFRNNTDQKDFTGKRDTPTGKALLYARPLKVNNESCLKCHNTPNDAPPEMLRQYGLANGFGWKLNEIIGAQIVSVPAAVPLGMADTAFHSLTLWLLGAFGGIVAIGNLCVAFLLRGLG
jgi:Protein of unknown function (DUF3365)